MSGEEWRGLPGWPAYQISSLGRVKRLACLSADGKRRLSDRLLTISRSGRNAGKYIYCYVQLGGVADTTPFSVARLVLLAFVGPPGPGQECRHLDDDSTHCALSNLAWGTRLENRQDAVRNKRMASGGANGGAKLTEAEVKEIRAVFKQYSRTSGARALASKFGVLPSTVSSVAHNHSWKIEQ